MTKTRNHIDSLAPPHIDRAIMPVKAHQKSKQNTNSVIVSIFRSSENVNEASANISTNAVNVIVFLTDIILVINKYVLLKEFCIIEKFPEIKEQAIVLYRI